MSEIGPLIRHWRIERRFSQSDLAFAAEVSTRHLSCVETGRAQPSREMVLILANALDLPLRERNALLLAAGFTPAYRATDLNDPAMDPLRRAVEHLLRGAEPYGALVMNHRWDLVLANRPWERIARLLLGRDLVPGENMMRLVFGELSAFFVDREATLGFLLDRLDHEARVAADRDLRELHDELAPSLPNRRPKPVLAGPPALTVDLAVGDLRLSLFTTLTTLGTPVDVCAAELRIEHYFPADAATEAFLRAL